MATQTQATELDPLRAEQVSFTAVLSDEELDALFAKHGVQDVRKRKLYVRCFFWLMVFSAGESSRRGSILHLIGFFVGAMLILFPEEKVSSLSKNALSKRLSGVSWYLFRGVYNHLLERYKKLIGAQEMRFLGRFRDGFVIDGSVISLGKQMEKVFASIHRGKSSLKLNTKYSLKGATVSKLQVSSGKRHDSRFAFVTQEPDCLYLVDLGYWSFHLLIKIMDASSFFVLRLKRSCDPLIVAVAHGDYQHLVGKRLSQIGDFLQAHVALGEIDLMVQLSTAKKPHFQDPIRLVGLFHEQQWRFYVTNIFEATFTPQLIYELYAQRWQVEIFFNLIKNVLNLENIISRSKNGIMVEIYSALIFYLFTRIVIALAARQTGRSIHEFSFERTFKLTKGFILPHFHRFLQPSLHAVNAIFQCLIDLVAVMGLAATVPRIVVLEQQLA